MTQKLVKMMRIISPKKILENNHSKLLSGLEQLRNNRGAFIASPSADYSACWVRDQLFSTLSYFYTGNKKKFREGVYVVSDFLKRHREKIENAITHPPKTWHDYIHAKFDADTLEEITNEWGHHQVDAIGLFLYIVAFAEDNKISVLRDNDDRKMIQLLVHYLISVRFWEQPDNGMWEEGVELHASSIGATTRGLTYIREKELAVVPMSAIYRGYETLYKLLPNESPEREVDMAQLSLIWPYNILDNGIRDLVLNKVKSSLVQGKGLNRYLGDNYYRSDNGVSAEWTFGFFWLSIIESELGHRDEARMWFDYGLKTMTPDGRLPELYQNGIPNKNTPLAWSHSFGLIAESKLN